MVVVIEGDGGAAVGLELFGFQGQRMGRPDEAKQQRDGEAGTGYPDVDAVLTTREFARMIKQANIDFVNLPDEDFDDVLGECHRRRRYLRCNRRRYGSGP